MFSSISAISHGAYVPANSISAALNRRGHCMLAISSCPRGPMISRSVLTLFKPRSSSLEQARLASTTAWIASPTETIQLLDELEELETANRS